MQNTLHKKKKNTNYKYIIVPFLKSGFVKHSEIKVVFVGKERNAATAFFTDSAVIIAVGSVLPLQCLKHFDFANIISYPFIMSWLLKQ